MTAAIRKSVSQASAIATTVSTINGSVGHTDGSLEPPQRSRNARAQARHRAKRKAYIEQLEETVTKLQSALQLTPDQVAAMPPAQIRIRDLEQENRRLREDINDLRLQLQQYTSPPTPSATSNSNSSNSHGHTNGYSHIPHSRPHSTQVHSLIHPSNRSGSHSPVSASTSESLGGSGSSGGNYFALVDFNDRDKKRKRLSPDNETTEKFGPHGSAYLTPGGTPPHHHDLHHVQQLSGNTYYNGYTTNGHSANHHTNAANGHSSGNSTGNNHTYLNSNGAPLNNSSASSVNTNGNLSLSKPPPLSLSLPLPSFGQQSHSHPLHQQQYIHGHSHNNGLSSSSSSLLSSHHQSHNNGHTNGYLPNVSSTPTNTNSGSSAPAATSSFSASIPSLALPSFPLPTPPLSSASSLLPPVFPLSSLPSPNLPLNPMSLPSPAPSPIPAGGTSESGAGSRITGPINLSNDKNRYYQNDHIYNFSHNYSPHKPQSLSVTTSFSTSSVSSLSSASDPSDSFRSLPPHVPNFDRDRIQRDRHADVDPYTPSPPSSSHSTTADIQSHNGTTNGHAHGQANGSGTPSSSTSTYLPSFSSHLGNNSGVGSLGHHLQNSPHSNGYSHSQQHHTNGHSSSYHSVVPKTEDDSYALSAHAQSPQTQTPHGHFSPSLPASLNGFNTEHGPPSASSQSAHSWNGMYTSERVAVQHR